MRARTTTCLVSVQLQLLLLMAVGVRSQLLQTHIDQFFSDVTITESSDGNSWTIVADGIPNDDDASSIERNPNEATDQTHSYSFYKTPDFSGQSSCTPLGPIGFALNGVPFFNALTAEGCDAVIYESFDDCEGHATDTGAYHYHQLSSCVPDDDDPETPLKLHGVALDGVLIYGPLDANGVNITNDRLDEYHGSSDILPSGDYAYFINYEYPYIVETFRGAIQYSGQCLTLVTDEETCSSSGAAGGQMRPADRPALPTPEAQESGSDASLTLQPVVIVSSLLIVLTSSILIT